MSLRIEAATRSHDAQAGALIVGIQRDEYGFDIGFDEQPDLRDIAAFYQTGDGGFWVAVDGERVVGTLALKDLGNHAVELRRMFVAASHRGRAIGAAAALLETAIAWARARGVREIVLGTTERFVAAHRFYEKHGFERIARDALPAGFLFMAADTRFYRMRIAAQAV